MKIEFNAKGFVELQGSKSILNRILIISTFFESSFKIYNFSRCDDLNTMVENLMKIGFRFYSDEDYLILVPPDKMKSPSQLFIKDSGTGFRFLLSRLASQNGLETTIDVSPQLQKRPIKPLVKILNQLGAEINDDRFPITVKGKKLKGGKIVIPANISSQFISSLLLIAPCYEQDLEISLKGEIVSRPYIEMTLQIMSDFGIESEFSLNNKIKIQSGQEYFNLSDFYIEPDFSSACYFWALGTLSNNNICTSNWYLDSVQPDFKFLGILKKMGAEISDEDDRICVKRKKLNGIEIEMRNMPDQVPTLVVLSLFADSKTIIRNISHLRFKESDRISALLNEIKRIGGKIEFKKNSLIIHPLTKPPKDVFLETYNDHRIVMAFSILKAIFPYIIIKNMNSVTKSYPDFFFDLDSICNIS